MTSLASPVTSASPMAEPETDVGVINTIQDPRTPPPMPRTRTSAQSDSRRSESAEDDEIAAMTTKLIGLANANTSLENVLHECRHDLNLANLRVIQLESATEEHEEAVSTGALVQKDVFDETVATLRAELATVKIERQNAQHKVREMEGEVENLTASLFDQANTMVADARREHEAEKRRNEQLQTQLRDNETLLASQNEQLQGLKDVVSRMGPARDDDHHTAPPSPSFNLENSKTRDEDARSEYSQASSMQLVPDHPLSLVSLVSLVSRSDIPSYSDFVELLRSSRPALTHARSSSGDSSAAASSIANTRPLTAMATVSSPNLPGAFNASSPRDATFSIGPPLKDTKFFKRALLEDIEPVLRLDLAPGLSWLARRAVLTSVSSGTMVIEPYMPSGKAHAPINACALCGEDGKDDAHARRHRFKTSDDPSAQKYPLCDYCLERMRSTAGFVAFLRQVRDGLWRSDTIGDMRSAWDHCIKLKEKMFWSRIGGGVIPVIIRASSHSPARELTGRDGSHEVTPNQSLTIDDPRLSLDRAAHVDKAANQVSIDEPSMTGTERVEHDESPK